MHLSLSDPILVAEAPFLEETGVDRWGQYQFPVIDRLLDGRIAVTFHVQADSALSYGVTPRQPNRGISADGGGTWSLGRSLEPVAGLLLPNGERLRAGDAGVNPRAQPVKGLKLPRLVGTDIGTYGQQRFDYFRHDELPPELQGVPLARFPRGGSEWIIERARLDDPELLRYTVEGVFPVLWWGDVHVLPDGALLAVVYPSQIAGAEFTRGHCVCYRSADAGRSWQVQGRILFRPDAAADPHAAGRNGFGEPASVVLRDGSLLVVLRTTDGLGVGPMYLTRSLDGGSSWSPPRAFRPTGVMPRLLRLGNGVLVLSSGRPGADLSFSLDGHGEQWTALQPLVRLASPGVQDDSCGYTSLLALDEETFLVAYSWFTRPDASGVPRKAVLVRRVTVRL